jgi:hypothetical protein
MLNGLKPDQLQEAFELWISELIGNKTFKDEEAIGGVVPEQDSPRSSSCSGN